MRRRMSPWILAARPKTLPAGVVPVAVGVALGAQAAAIDWLVAVLCLIGSLLIQIGCNFANDAIDARKGADTAQRVGPQRAVASGLITPRQMLIATAVVLTLAFAVGLYLSSIGGWPILVLGMISIACAIAYTGGPFPLAYIGLGDVFVLLFFGWFATLGSAWLQVAAVAPQLPIWWWLVATAVGAQATAILVVNNVRDRSGDAEAAKRTLVVRFGRAFGVGWFAFLHLTATACLATCSWWIGPIALIPAALAAVGGGLGTWSLARHEGSDLNRLLARSAILELITGAAVVAVCMVPT